MHSKIRTEKVWKKNEWQKRGNGKRKSKMKGGKNENSNYCTLKNNISLNYYIVKYSVTMLKYSIVHYI
jgi:hypothetical protein